MANLDARFTILSESKTRVKALKFGEPVTNICASGKNPGRHCIFVEFVVKTHKNKWGVSHSDYWAKCTDGKGKFWNVDIDVIYPGHLDEAESSKLFQPVWNANYGESK